MKNNRLFFNLVKYIEIEISSSCNRKCVYCTNARFDREKATLPKQYFLKIMEELQTIDYSNVIAFHQYNEPLLELDYLYWCIKKTRASLPCAILSLYTNGDYLNEEIYKELQHIGINEIHISCHLNENESWSQELSYQKIQAMKKKINLSKGRYLYEENRISWLPSQDEMFISEAIKRDVKRINHISEYPFTTYIISTNFCEEGSSRMDKIENIKIVTKDDPKTFFCPCIIQTLNISHKGNCFLCWDCYDGSEDDQKYYIGNIADKSVFDIYRGKGKLLEQYFSEEGLECCKNCFWDNI